MKQGYLFCNPWGYDSASAGIRAWFRLGEILKEKEYQAKYFTNIPLPGKVLMTPPKPGVPSRPVSINVDDSKWITIYSDTTNGNPMRAKKIARWLEYYPDFFGIPTNIGKDEIVFVWEYEFYPQAHHQLRIDVIEPFFNSENITNRRDIEAAYYIGKGTRRGLSINPPTNAIEITKTWPSSRLELAGLLRRVNTLYVFDQDTLLAQEAIRCGCKVLFPSGEEVPAAPKYDYDAMVDNFIKVTQEAYG